MLFLLAMALPNRCSDTCKTASNNDAGLASIFSRNALLLHVKIASKMLAARVAMFLGASFMGGVGLFLTYLTKGLGISVFGAVEFRGLFGLAWISIILAASKKLHVIKELLEHKSLVLAVTVTSVLTIFFYFMTIDTAGLAIAAFLLYVGNLVAVLFMRAFLKEPMARITYVAYGLALAGVLVMEPWGDATLTWGIITGISSAIILGFLNLSKKKLFMTNAASLAGKSLPETDISLGLTWYTTLGLLAGFSFSWINDAPVMATWNAMFAAVFLGLIPTALAFSLFNYGFQSDKGGNVLIISYAEPVVAAVFQVLFFGGVPLAVVIGGACIIAGNIITLKARKPGQE